MRISVCLHSSNITSKKKVQFLQNFLKRKRKELKNKSLINYHVLKKSQNF